MNTIHGNVKMNKMDIPAKNQNYSFLKEGRKRN